MDYTKDRIVSLKKYLDLLESGKREQDSLGTYKQYLIVPDRYVSSEIFGDIATHESLFYLWMDFKISEKWGDHMIDKNLIASDVNFLDLSGANMFLGFISRVFNSRLGALLPGVIIDDVKGASYISSAWNGVHIRTLGGFSILEHLGGPEYYAKVDVVKDDARLVFVGHSSKVGTLKDRARISRLEQSAQVDLAQDCSIIEKMVGSETRVHRMRDRARILNKPTRNLLGRMTYGFK